MVRLLDKKEYLITVVLTIALLFATISTSHAYEIYTAKTGDSLFKISEKFGTNISTLTHLNQINNANLIYIGQKIKIPTNNKTKSKIIVSNGTSSNLVDNNDQPITDPKTTSNSSSTYKDKKWQEDKKNVKAEKKNSTKKFYRKGPNTMKIALTFDDGPDPKFTPQVLEVLKEKDVKATFFLVGKRAKKNPEVVKQILKDGHTVANHSWSHADLSKLAKEEVNQEVLDTEKELKEITGRETALIRPPYGAMSDDLLDQLQTMNYKIIHWSIDSLDWKAQNKEEVINKILPKIHAGAIILFHSAGGEGQSLMPTINALPTIIDNLKEKNIKLVTVDKLLSLSAYKG